MIDVVAVSAGRPHVLAHVAAVSEAAVGDEVAALLFGWAALALGVNLRGTQRSKSGRNWAERNLAHCHFCYFCNVICIGALWPATT